MNQNILQLAYKNVDVMDELKRINRFLDETHILYMDDGFINSYPLEGYVSMFYFDDWKLRERCIDLEDLKKRLRVDKTQRKILDSIELNADEITVYLEYVESLLYLVRNYYIEDSVVSVQFNRYYDVLRAVLDSLEDYLNLERQPSLPDESVLLVDKDIAVTAAVDILPDDLSAKIILYNHHSVKGDLAKKKDILFALANALEPPREKLKELDGRLEDYLFFLLNKCEIRHNNKIPENKHYNESVANMSDEELEKWYDRIFQMALFAFQVVDKEIDIKSIADLKKNMGGKKND